VAVKKISISLPSGLYAALAQWAAKEDTNPTSLATDLIAALIRKEISEGRLTLEAETSENLQQMGEFVKLLMGLRPRNGLSFAEIADITGLPSRQVEELYHLVETCRKQHEPRNK
jgi:DNA-directed RNA polymerase specialized sigma24 family protein